MNILGFDVGGTKISAVIGNEKGEIIGPPLIGLVFILVGAILILAEFKLGHGFMMITGMVVSLIGAFLLAPIKPRPIMIRPITLNITLP